jgi:hypothetical protein
MRNRKFVFVKFTGQIVKEQKSHIHLSGIEPWFLGCPVYNIVPELIFLSFRETAAVRWCSKKKMAATLKSELCLLVI